MFHENWYSESQCAKVSELVRSTRHLNGDIIEIGCWEGKSTISLANACHPETIICNDTWLGNIAESIVTGQTHPTELIVKERDVYSQFVKNMTNHTKGNYSVAKMDCLEWLKTSNAPIKFVHIDASHEYESVYETIRIALPRMVPGGIMCGDDILSAHINRHDLHGGVERAVRELLPGYNVYDNLWYYTIPSNVSRK
jgi:predicted O-methyltransferase YrrM